MRINILKLIFNEGTSEFTVELETNLPIQN